MNDPNIPDTTKPETPVASPDVTPTEEKKEDIQAEEVKVEQPIKEEAQSTESPVEEAVVIKDKEKEIGGKVVLTIRSEETGDKVYLIRDGKRFWVRNPETLAKLGFRMGQEKSVPFSELLKYPEGEPLDLTPPNAVFPWDKPEVPVSNEPTTPFKVWQ